MHNITYILTCFNYILLGSAENANIVEICFICIYNKAYHYMLFLYQIPKRSAVGNDIRY